MNKISEFGECGDETTAYITSQSGECIGQIERISRKDGYSIDGYCVRVRTHPYRYFESWQGDGALAYALQVKTDGAYVSHYETTDAL